ncbi:MAG: TRAP transporter small permease [Ignavibacteria bacterium]|nr:TRAP transporter small permease [Ignavibacteria bacterium]
MRFLRRFDRWLTHIEVAFLVVSLSAMVLLSFTQVVLRNLFDTGLVWADPIVRHLVLWGGFSAAAIAASEGRHIGIDALTKFLSSRIKAFSQILTNAFAAVICWVLADAAWTFLLSEKESGGEIVLSIPTWIAILIIPIGYMIMALHFLIRGVFSGSEAFRQGGGGERP